MKLAVFSRLILWRIKHIPDSSFMYILSIIVGIIAGFAAIIMKNSVRAIHHFLQYLDQQVNLLYLFYPFVGILMVVLFVKYVVRQKVGHGIPRILYAISRGNGIIKVHNTFSSIVGSIITVGFGGSVGLEGPSASTGAALGSNIAQLLRLNYKKTILLIGCGATGAIAAIFNTPIAAIVFSLEVLMLDLSIASLIPLLLSSTSAIIISYFWLGQQTIWGFEKDPVFNLNHFPYYIVLGIITGFISIYFAKVQDKVEHIFEKIKQPFIKLIIGSFLLGLLIFLFPSLYGEGYEQINSCLHGNLNFIFDDTIYSDVKSTSLVVIVILSLIILLKPWATSITFGSGGIGGIFAPSLFIGSITGFLYAYIVNTLGFNHISVHNFALVGMAGVLSGILHGPLTAIFLIADVTGSYELIVPLMITSIFSYATSKQFVPNSIYTTQLAKRKELMTHDKNASVLNIMQVENLLETDFAVFHPDDSLGTMVSKIAVNKRNVFPVVDSNNVMVGILTLNDVREYIFKPELYKKLYVKDIMYPPATSVNLTDTIEEITKKIHNTGRYNIPVLDNGKYAGFISRANVFATYQKLLDDYTVNS